MNSLRLLTSNPLVNLSFISWATAQLIKTILDWTDKGSLNTERLVGSGGMPSSHSSLTCALVVGIAKSEGFSSPLFAMALAFAGVVMYDAMGVRRAAGEQAKALNKMMFNFRDITQFFLYQKDNIGDDSNDENDEEDADDLSPNDLTDTQMTTTSTKHEAPIEKSLKEFLGHTPMEVLAGALLGILIATIYPIGRP